MRSRRGERPEKRSHVWIINHYASRPGEPAIRHYALAKELLEHGWDASIVACSTQHYTGRQRLSGWKVIATELVDRVEYRWLRMPAYRDNGVMRVLNMVGFAAFVLVPFATRGLTRPDAVIGSTVHPFAAWAAASLARRHRVPFIFEIRDLWPETLVELGSMKRGGLVAALLYRLERHLCDRASVVVTSMPFAVDYLVTRGVDRNKVRWISNGVWVNEFPALPSSVNFYDGSSKKFLFVYFGALGTANCVDELVRGFASAGLPHSVGFKIVGSGPKREELAALIDELGLRARVELADAVPRTEIPALAGEAGCLVLAMQESALYNYGMSLNKLFEYMASARPILFAGQARGNPVVESKGGVCTSPNAEAIAEGMRTILRASEQERIAMGRRNRELVAQRFEYGVLAKRLAEVLCQATAP